MILQLNLSAKNNESAFFVLKTFFSLSIMTSLFIFLCLIQCTIALKCYDCTDCPYPWSSFGIETYGSILSVFSRVRSCYVSI